MYLMTTRSPSSRLTVFPAFFSHFPSAFIKGTCREIFSSGFLHDLSSFRRSFHCAPFRFFQKLAKIYLQLKVHRPQTLANLLPVSTTPVVTPFPRSTLIVVTLWCQRRCRNLPYSVNFTCTLLFIWGGTKWFWGGTIHNEGHFRGGGPKIETFLGP